MSTWKSWTWKILVWICYWRDLYTIGASGCINPPYPIHHVQRGTWGQWREDTPETTGLIKPIGSKWMLWPLLNLSQQRTKLYLPKPRYTYQMTPVLWISIGIPPLLSHFVMKTLHWLYRWKLSHKKNPFILSSISRRNNFNMRILGWFI